MRCWGLLMGALLAACATVPGPRTQAERLQRATHDERTLCVGLPPADWSLVAPPNLVRVEPVYFSVQHGRGNVDRELRGVRVVVRARPGLTAESIALELSCHRARTLLGHDDGAPPGDPFALPGAWVDIGVEPGEASYVVTLRSEDPRDDEELLARAQSRLGTSVAR